jgi:protein TonB
MSAVMYRGENRAFNYAVLASIALHGLMLFGFSQRDPAGRIASPLPITARLVEPPAPAPLPQFEPAKPQPRLKPSAAKPIAKAPPQPSAAPAPPAVEEAAPVAPEAPARPEAAAAPAVPAPGMVAKIDPVPASSPTAEAGSIAQYRLQLISVARKYKRYPRVAMDNNWEGDVVVRMAIGANGMIAALSIKSSSGHEVLDRQALEMFKHAQAQVHIPAPLRGKEFSLELRAIYNFKDQDSV